MTEVKWKLSETSEGSTVAVLIDGEIKMLSDKDENFSEVLELVRNGYTPSIELFDLAPTVSAKFESLSERVTVRSGRVYFDGDELDSSLTRHITRLLRDGVEDWKHFVLFLEKLEQNPEPHSREQLYDWLADRDFTITEDGDFLAYKGVHFGASQPGGGKTIYRSTHAGNAIVDGVEYKNEQIPNYVGAVVEMPRSGVEHNPSEACSVGLHAGTYEFANNFGATLLTVKVNPRDVVSVPTDSNGQKLRVCRYQVIGEIEKKLTIPFYRVEDEEDEYDDLDDEDAIEDGGFVFTRPGTGTITWQPNSGAVTTWNEGTYGKATTNSQAKLDWASVDRIRLGYENYSVPVEELAKEFDVSERTIQRIVNYESWVL